MRQSERRQCRCTDDGHRVDELKQDIKARLPVRGYDHRGVRHRYGEDMRDEDGDGFHEIHVNTIKGMTQAAIVNNMIIRRLD